MSSPSTDSLSDGLNSVPMESYIIGSILNDYALMDELMTVIPVQMFSNSLHAELWQTMCDMRINEKPIDIASLSIEAPQTVTRISIKQLLAMKGSSLGRTGIDHHVKKLTEIFIRRELVKGARLLAQRASDTGTSVDQLMAGYEQIAMTIQQTAASTGLHDGDTYTEEWMHRVRKKMENPMGSWGFITGWMDIDNLTLGWHRKELVVVGGRTSVGKTAFAVENIVRMLMAGRKTAVFSLEMSEDDMKDRIASNVVGIPYQNMRVGKLNEDDYQALEKQKRLISSMAITDERGVSTEYIIAQMKRWKRQRGLDFVVVDYLQEIQERKEANDNGGSALKRIVQKLRKAAKDCDCVVMAMSQLTRDAEGKKPTLASLAGSSGIENVADVTILLHRDRKVEPDLMDVDVAKDRNGKTGEVRMNYNMMTQRIKADRDSRDYIG